MTLVASWHSHFTLACSNKPAVSQCVKVWADCSELYLYTVCCICQQCVQDLCCSGSKWKHNDGQMGLGQEVYGILELYSDVLIHLLPLAHYWKQDSDTNHGIIAAQEWSLLQVKDGWLWKGRRKMCITHTTDRAELQALAKTWRQDLVGQSAQHNLSTAYVDVFCIHQRWKMPFDYQIPLGQRERIQMETNKRQNWVMFYHLSLFLCFAPFLLHLSIPLCFSFRYHSK